MPLRKGLPRRKWRPAERLATNDVQVQVIYALATIGTGIHHSSIATLRNALAPRDLSRHGHQAPEQSSVVRLVE